MATHRPNPRPHMLSDDDARQLSLKTAAVTENLLMELSALGTHWAAIRAAVNLDDKPEATAAAALLDEHLNSAGMEATALNEILSALPGWPPLSPAAVAHLSPATSAEERSGSEDGPSKPADTGDGRSDGEGSGEEEGDDDHAGSVVKMKELEVVDWLGKGAVGKVYLVRHGKLTPSACPCSAYTPRLTCPMLRCCVLTFGVAGILQSGPKSCTPSKPFRSARCCKRRKASPTPCRS